MSLPCPPPTLPSLEETLDLTYNVVVAERIDFEIGYDILCDDVALATNDAKHVLMFLADFDGSADTFKAYRRDLERLLMWMWTVQGVCLKEVDNRVLRLFLDFLGSPPQDWIMKSQYRRATASGPNPNWRPFRSTSRAYRFSDSSYKAMVVSLSSFFTHISNIGYIERNPMLQIRQLSKFTGAKKERKIKRLSNLQLQYCFQACDAMAEENPDRFERTRFLFNVMVKLYLRISEVAEKPQHRPVMGDFFRDHNGSWWFNVGYGKGRKSRDVSVPDDLLADLRRFREYLGLSSLPAPNEKEPLFPKRIGRGSISTERQVRRLLDEVFVEAKFRLAADGHSEEAESLPDATAHWLRHTGISEDVTHRPISHVRDDAGHNDIKTTSIYIDSDRLERSRSRNG